MSIVRDGVPASEGIARGHVHLLEWETPEAPHRPIEPDEVEDEVQKFRDALEWTRRRLLALQEEAQERLGNMEARIFEPQLVMLEDPELVEPTIRYIRENRLSAARAFEWRSLELQSRWSRTFHPMVLDRMNDLEDLHSRVLHRLLDLPDPWDTRALGDSVIVVSRNLTPSFTIQLDPERIRGIATDMGTRTAHWAILARSLSIPAVVGLGDVTRVAQEGQDAILDGRIGKVVLDPGERDLEVFEARRVRLQEWEVCHIDCRVACKFADYLPQPFSI